MWGFAFHLLLLIVRSCTGSEVPWLLNLKSLIWTIEVCISLALCFWGGIGSLAIIRPLGCLWADENFWYSVTLVLMSAWMN